MKYPEPEYAQNVIVGVIVRNTFAWYVTEKEYWYLDYTKYDDAFNKLYPQKQCSPDYSSRFYIAILNEETVKNFLSHIADKCIPTRVLSEMMIEQRKLYEIYSSLDDPEYFDERLAFVPCFLVDFDHRQFSSLYPEMVRFDLYIPDGWTGSYRDFLSDIPEDKRYWIVDGKNLFE